MTSPHGLTTPSTFRRTLRIMPNDPFPITSRGSYRSSGEAMVARGEEGEVESWRRLTEFEADARASTLCRFEPERPPCQRRSRANVT